MTAHDNATRYGRNFDGAAGDVLERLQQLLANTPPHALATHPIRRALLEATVAEIERLRAANEELIAWGASLDEEGHS